jgi:hypothetical protein
VVWNVFLVVDTRLACASYLPLVRSQHRYHVSVPSVDRQRIVQPFISCSHRRMFCDCCYHLAFTLHVFCPVHFVQLLTQEWYWSIATFDYANQEQVMCGVFLYIQAILSFINMLKYFISWKRNINLWNLYLIFLFYFHGFSESADLVRKVLSALKVWRLLRWSREVIVSKS